jgi:integrase
MINYRGFGAVKIDRHGKAKVLSAEEIQRLFTLGLTTERDRTLIGVMLYTGCRVNEAVTLKIKDIYNSKGRIRAELIIRKGNTKGKLATRSIPILSELRNFLATYKPTNSRDGFLFPGRWGRGSLALRICKPDLPTSLRTCGHRRSKHTQLPQNCTYFHEQCPNSSESHPRNQWTSQLRATAKLSGGGTIPSPGCDRGIIDAITAIN